jgi:hypothetical protein
MTEEKERLKSDMVAPQPSEHPDYRKHLTLNDLYFLSEHQKITYRLVFSSIGKRGD